MEGSYVKGVIIVYEKFFKYSFFYLNMSEQDKIISNKVKQKGIFDFKELYTFCYTWLSDEGYFVSEDKYGEKITGDSKEIEIRWVAERKISDYFKFRIKIEWFVVGLKDVEVEKMGKKVKINTGDVEVKATGYLIKDYESRWETNGFMKFLRGVYDQYIIKSRVEQYEDKLVDEIDEFLGEIKAFLMVTGRRS